MYVSWQRTQNRSLPIKVPKLNFAGRTTELKMSLKHLGVMLDENISWKPHINIFKKENIENYLIVAES